MGITFLQWNKRETPHIYTPTCDEEPSPYDPGRPKSNGNRITIFSMAQHLCLLRARSHAAWSGNRNVISGYVASFVNRGWVYPSGGKGWAGPHTYTYTCEYQFIRRHASRPPCHNCAISLCGFANVCVFGHCPRNQPFAFTCLWFLTPTIYNDIQRYWYEKLRQNSYGKPPSSAI